MKYIFDKILSYSWTDHLLAKDWHFCFHPDRWHNYKHRYNTMYHQNIVMILCHIWSITKTITTLYKLIGPLPITCLLSQIFKNSLVDIGKSLFFTIFNLDFKSGQPTSKKKYLKIFWPWALLKRHGFKKMCIWCRKVGAIYIMCRFNNCDKHCFSTHRDWN